MTIAPPPSWDEELPQLLAWKSGRSLAKFWQFALPWPRGRVSSRHGECPRSTPPDLTLFRNNSFTIQHECLRLARGSAVGTGQAFPSDHFLIDTACLTIARFTQVYSKNCTLEFLSLRCLGTDQSAARLLRN